MDWVMDGGREEGVIIKIFFKHPPCIEVPPSPMTPPRVMVVLLSWENACGFAISLHHYITLYIMLPFTYQKLETIRKGFPHQATTEWLFDNSHHAVS